MIYPTLHGISEIAVISNLARKIDSSSASQTHPQIENYFNINHLAAFIEQRKFIFLIAWSSTLLSWVLSCSWAALIDIYDISGISPSLCFYYILYDYDDDIFFITTSKDSRDNIFHFSLGLVESGYSFSISFYWGGRNDEKICLTMLSA